MEETLKVLNEMEREGVIGRYAIGGAVGASYYVEPSVTYDLDVFAVIGSPGMLTDLSPLYQWLGARGYKSQGAGVRIGDWEVQFLTEDAVDLEKLREIAFRHGLLERWEQVTRSLSE